MEYFDEIGWLNSYFPNQEIKADEIKSVLYFSLMWNLFDFHACGKRANTEIITDSVNQAYSQRDLAQQYFEPFLTYFKNRYVEGGRTNSRFDKFEFRRGDKKELVNSVLLGELDDLNNVVLALLLIVLRLRNNLFHGEKDIYRLNYQAENFHVANQVLANFLTAWKRHGVEHRSG